MGGVCCCCCKPDVWVRMWLVEVVEAGRGAGLGDGEALSAPAAIPMFSEERYEVSVAKSRHARAGAYGCLPDSLVHAEALEVHHVDRVSPATQQSPPVYASTQRPLALARLSGRVRRLPTLDECNSVPFLRSSRSARRTAVSLSPGPSGRRSQPLGGALWLGMDLQCDGKDLRNCRCWEMTFNRTFFISLSGEANSWRRIFHDLGGVVVGVVLVHQWNDIPNSFGIACETLATLLASAGPQRIEDVVEALDTVGVGGTENQAHA